MFACFRRVNDGAGIRFGRHHLRSAGGAVERPVGQRAHLGVAALAGVLAHSVRKGDNLLKRLYEGAVKGAATVLAVGRARERPLRAQRAVSARRADEVVRPGRSNVRFNLNPPHVHPPCFVSDTGSKPRRVNIELG